MFRVRRDGRGFLEVTEILFYFTTTRRRFWYYDTTNWLRSVRGAEGEVPRVPMIPEEIARVEDFYLPRLGKR
jgi:hypothetical protein